MGMANRAHTRGFPSILRNVREVKDWMVERVEFELTSDKRSYLSLPGLYHWAVRISASLALPAKRAFGVIFEARNTVRHGYPGLSSRTPDAETRVDRGLVVQGPAHHRANSGISVQGN